MPRFLELDEIQRREAFLRVSVSSGLQETSVEKDFWVCWTLHQLSAWPGVGDKLTFKGGTSLAKAWGLIQRFSEDLDLVIDREVLGFGGDNSPDAAPSKKQFSIRVKQMREACADWLREALLEGFTSRARYELGPAGWLVEIDPNARDEDVLLFHYPSVFGSGAEDYVTRKVKLELGARSETEPQEIRSIQSYLEEHLPGLDSDTTCEIRCLAPERTFWEKVCLLHEERFRPAEKPRGERMFRHYYDLWCLLRAGVGERALADKDLFEQVVRHRERYFRHGWVDYSTHRARLLRIVPPDDQIITGSRIEVTDYLAAA